MTTSTTSPQNSSPKSQSQSQSQTQTQKKQVRRRLHTSRPYQERLLNMAEARREIVTALKQHRASMKAAAAQKQHQIPLHLHPHPPQQQQQSLPFSWNLPHLNFILPNQPLGLNLNFQDFNDIIQTSSSYSSSSSLASSSSSPPTLSTTSESPNLPNSGLRHVAEEEEEMIRIRSMEEASSGLWVEEDHDVFPTIIEFPSWLNPTEELLHPYNQNLTHYSSLPQDPALSCMEIGEIEGEDWLA